MSTSTSSEIGLEKREFAANMFKLLGHPLRLHIVEILDLHGKLSVNEIAEKTQMPQPTVSLYLNRLKTLGLLGSTRVANQTYYYITHPKVPILLDCIRGCPLES